MEELLMALLQCGSLDLSILDGVGYDLGEIVEELRAEGLEVTLNLITGEIFRKGQIELEEAVMEAIEDRKAMMLGCDEDEEERLQEEIDELETLDPESDMDWFCNCLDTSCWFAENEEVYRKYLADKIREIEDNMGFSF